MTLLLHNVTVPSPLNWEFQHSMCQVECSSSPIFTSKDICPSGQMVSLLNPIRISKDAPPSTYIQCTKCPPILASMIIGPSVPSSSPKGGKEITVSGEKLWVTLCLSTLSHAACIRPCYALYLRGIHSTFLDPFFPQELPLVAEP
ncbi:hypothetical protein Tco_0492688 [Tanacetum coccineum]